MYWTSTARKKRGESHVCNETPICNAKNQTANDMSRGILELTADCATDRTANKKGKERPRKWTTKIKPTPFDARGNRMISERTGIADAIAMREKSVDGKK